jgi:NADH-quinone oxidoreductase subunit E
MGESKKAASVSDHGPPDHEVQSYLRERKVSPTGNLIGVLQDVQDRFGYLPAYSLREISRRMKVPLSKVYGVVSFYAQFYTQPRGRHTIKCCRGTACHVRGAERVIDTVRRTLGIDEGQTTPDMQFYLETIACLGTCFLAPAMMIDNQYFGRLTPQRVQGILRSYQAKET